MHTVLRRCLYASILIQASLLAGCYVVTDKLEAVAFVGFSEPPCAPAPGAAKPFILQPGGEVPLWFRLVYWDNTSRPIYGRAV